MRLLASLLLVLVLASTARAQGYYERSPGELPAAADRSAKIVVVSPKAGTVHWGLNGWNQPATSLRPSGTTVYDSASVETPLEGPCADGKYRTALGPFDQGASSPTELDLVLHFADGTWDSNGGNNYKVSLVAPGQAPVRRRPITIGRGPWLGQLAGDDVFEDMGDWQAEDCRGVSAPGDEHMLGDGLDDSRDIVAFYSRRENNALYLRVDLLDLALGAETAGGVVLGFLVSWDGAGGQVWLPDFVHGQSSKPWNMALVLRDSNTFQVFDQNWNILVTDASDPNHWWRGASYRSDLDAVELGLDLGALRKAGWDGKTTLKFQVYSQHDGNPTLTDVFADPGAVNTGQLNAQCDETARSGTAKLSVIVHGNQSIQQPSAVRELISSPAIVTPNGKPTGYHRALDAHVMFRVPVNVHVSGTLASTLEWAAPGFNDRIRGLVSGKPWLGQGALVGGVLSEHMMPYFESSKIGGGAGPNVQGALLNDRLLAGIYHVQKPRVFWTPERVIRGTTFADITQSGYSFTVVDQVTHIRDWFGSADAYSTNGHKLNKISGVSCFLINDAEDQKKFGNTDGGLYIDSRRSLLGRALDQDQQQLTLLFDDWEAYSGRSFTSFGIGNDNPDNYDLNVRWIACHPWIQVATLDEISGWGWNAVDRGNQPNLSIDTYDWLRHATEIGYDHWFYGSNLEQDFHSLHPTILNGQQTPKTFGQLGQSGSILGDAWSDVSALPASPLRDAAAAVYGVMAFETAWHDNSMNDYYDKTGSGDYAQPDTSYQNVSSWAIALQSHMGDASLVAAAGRWAQSPPAVGTLQVWSGDIDQDGQPEYAIASNTAFCVFKATGGRLVLAASRDATTGDADLLVGALLQGPGSQTERDRLETTSSDVKRPPALVDWWATGGAGSYYVNANFSATQLTNGWQFTSPDGKVRKTVTLSGGRLSVTYNCDPSVGDMYIRSGLSPLSLGLFLGEARISESRSSSALTVQSQAGSKTGAVTVTPGSQCSINDQADFGPDGAHSLALERQVELHGMGTQFGFTLDLSVSH